MRANLRDNGKILGRCCLRRMRCGRIFGHMRFEALGSRSLLLWMRTHRGCVFICPAAGGGSHVFLVLLERKLSTSRVVQNRQNSIKIHSKPSKIDKNSFQIVQKLPFVATRVMWAAHESCFLFILAAEIFLELELDKRGILWYNISIMGSLCSFAAAPLSCCCCLDPINAAGTRGGSGPMSNSCGRFFDLAKN